MHIPQQGSRITLEVDWTFTYARCQKKITCDDDRLETSSSGPPFQITVSEGCDVVVKDVALCSPDRDDPSRVEFTFDFTSEVFRSRLDDFNQIEPQTITSPDGSEHDPYMTLSYCRWTERTHIDRFFDSRSEAEDRVYNKKDAAYIVRDRDGLSPYLSSGDEFDPRSSHIEVDASDSPFQCGPITRLTRNNMSQYQSHRFHHRRLPDAFSFLEGRDSVYLLEDRSRRRARPFCVFKVDRREWICRMHPSLSNNLDWDTRVFDRLKDAVSRAERVLMDQWENYEDHLLSLSQAYGIGLKSKSDLF